MNKTRFLTLAFLLTLSGFGGAFAQAPSLESGTYKLTVGSNAPCDLTIGNDGTVTQAADCATGRPIAKWTAKGSDYALTTASGEVYAVLKPHDNALEGISYIAQHKLVLTH